MTTLLFNGFNYRKNPLNEELFDRLEELSRKKRKNRKSLVVELQNQYVLGDYQQEVIERLLEDHNFNEINDLINSGLCEPDVDVDDETIKVFLKTSKKRVLTAPHNF